jgi:putative SOS response-associated peptidase YedK
VLQFCRNGVCAITPRIWPIELCAEIYNRVPVILKPEAQPAWLGEEPADEPQLTALLASTLPRYKGLAGPRARRQCPE